MTLARFIRLFKERLSDRVGEKTAFGRNEIQAIVNELIEQLLLEALEEE